MALVDYNSSDDSEPEPAESESESRPSTSNKKRKISHYGQDENAIGSNKPAATALPPLPSTFHNLYASTVRVSNVDDPSLHQGRKRQLPHVVGNWPSHLYIEWHPTNVQHAALTKLLTFLKEHLDKAGLLSPGSSVSSFLTSDLGTPLPLHISLSRPIVFSTTEKDAFLEKLKASIRGCGVRPFELVPTGLEWHRTADSSRSFLVLRVSSREAPSSKGGNNDHSEQGIAHNPELMLLLRKCNDTVMEFNQAPLYAQAGSGTGSHKFTVNNGGGKQVSDAFHISVAWSFAELTEELRHTTHAAFERGELRKEIGKMRIRVDGIKSKIGNAVTHIPLPEGVRKGGGTGQGLFGI